MTLGARSPVAWRSGGRRHPTRERRLHPTRRAGEEVADAYLERLRAQTAETGVILIAEVEGAFAGFAAGWIEEEQTVEETPDSNRFGYVSDVCVLSAYRGRRIAGRLLDAVIEHLRHYGVMRVRLTALANNASARAAYGRAGFALYELVYEKVLVPLSGPARPAR